MGVAHGQHLQREHKRLIAPCIKGTSIQVQGKPVPFKLPKSHLFLLRLSKIYVENYKNISINQF